MPVLLHSKEEHKEEKTDITDIIALADAEDEAIETSPDTLTTPEKENSSPAIAKLVKVDTALRLITSIQYKNESKILDIYFYGAPTTFHFLKHSEKYIPILLNTDRQSSGISTVAVLHYNKKESVDTINYINDALEAYHKNFFETAFSDQGSEMLNNARLAYNKYSKLIRHDSFFYTPESFNNCIFLHHSYNNKCVKKCKSEEDKLQLNITDTKRRNFHVHYGAGKLGIGLVLPLIKPDATSSNQLIVIQKDREESEWSKKIKLKSGLITLSNSDKWELEFKLHKLANDSLLSFDEGDHFVLFEYLIQIKNVLQIATSISYSLNNTFIEEEFLTFLSTLEFDRPLLLFPFENKPYGSANEKDKAKFETIKSGFTNLKYVRLKADRICPNRLFNLNNKVVVSCEGHIEVVLNVSTELTNSLFPIAKEQNGQIIFADDDQRFSFLSKRKEYLVNELHFILVVYGYDFLISKEIVHWENQFVTIIQSALTSDPTYKIPIDTFIRLQIIRLLYPKDKEYDSSVLNSEYKLDDVALIYECLLSYAKATTNRFNASKEDPISRVFNTNDAKAIGKKYDSIINKIEKFVLDDGNREFIEKIQIISAGTYLEYKILIEDIKEKIQNILAAKMKDFKYQVDLKEKEQKEKEDELNTFAKTIENLIKKDVSSTHKSIVI